MTTPNPFMSIPGGACLCECPKFYFKPTDKASTFPRIAHLKAEQLNNVVDYFESKREVVAPPNPTGAIVQSTGISPSGFKLVNMSVPSSLDLDITNQILSTVHSYGNLSGSGTGLSAGDPIPENAIIGKLYIPAINMPVPIGNYITNDVTAGEQVTYFDAVFDEKYMADAQIVLQRTAETEITIYVTCTNPGTDLIPGDFEELMNADFAFTYVGGGEPIYNYSIKSSQALPANDSETVTVGWIIADSASTTQNGTNANTVEQWKDWILIYTSNNANDPVINNWTPKFTIDSAIVDNFPDRIGYRSEKPFMIIGLSDFIHSSAVGPYNPIGDIYYPDFALSTEAGTPAMLAFIITAFKNAASFDSGYAYQAAQSLFASFFGDNWNAYFENRINQCKSNQTQLITPGMTFEALGADAGLIYNLLSNAADETTFDTIFKKVWESCDPNLFLPPGIYGFGNSETYTSYLEAWSIAHDFEYPTLTVMQIIS